MLRVKYFLLINCFFLFAVDTLLFSQSAVDSDTKLSFTSAVGLGTQGFTTTNDVALQDSLGMAYDVSSLLKNTDVRSAVQLSEEQKSEISNRHNAIVEQLFTLDLVSMTDEERERWKSKFQKAELELQQLLTQEQLSTLQTMRYHLAISEFGLEKVLQAKILGDDLKLSEEQIAKVVSDLNVAKEKLAQSRLDLLSKANQSVLDLLPESRQDIIENLLNKKQMERLLYSPLFVNGNTRPRKKLPQVSALKRYLGRASVQEELDLKSDTVQEITLMIADLEKKNIDDQAQWKALEVELDPNTFRSLVSWVALDQAKMFGTVNSVSVGIVAHGIAWKDEDKTSFHKECNAVFRDYLQQVQQAKSSAMLMAFESLPSSLQTGFKERIGGRGLPLLETSGLQLK